VINKIPPKARLLWSLLSLFLIFWLPSGIESWFNGWPWSGHLETVLLVLVIPFLILTGRKFLSFPAVTMALTALCIIKIFLTVWAPPAGWNLRIYAATEKMAKGHWEETYTSILKPGVSEILEKPFLTKREFPIEWMNRLNSEQQSNAQVGLEIFGVATIPEGARLAIITHGAITGKWTALGEGGNRNVFPLIRTREEVAFSPVQIFPEGKVRVSGKIIYGSGEWSLEPILIWPGGRTESAFDYNILWRSTNGLSVPAFKLKLFSWVARGIDWGILFFVLFWFIWVVRFFWRKGYLTPSLFLLGLTGIPLPWVVQKLSYPMINDPTLKIYLAVSVFLLGTGFLVWSFFRSDISEEVMGSLGTLCLLVIGPGILCFFGVLWWSDVGRMTFYALPGDDWTAYQNLAREIFVGRDPWHIKNPVFVYQPLYRYFVGGLHFLFGQSSVAQNFLDVWALLGAAGILVSLGSRMGLSPTFALAAAWFYLVPALGGAFRHHIGRGLQEHAAMLFMMLAAWMITRSKDLILRNAMQAGSLAVIGFWLRMDHLGILVGVGLLAVTHPPGSLGMVWKRWLQNLYALRRELAVFMLMLGLALLAVFLRNWILGGQWVLTDPANMGVLRCTSWSCVYLNFKKLLFAYDPNLPFTSFLVSMASALILFFGTIIGLMALIWRKGPLVPYPLSLGLSLAGLLSPYFWVKVVAYPPRFSIHLLPLAALSLAVFLNHLIIPRLQGRFRSLKTV
jgi:hypothetical protein